MSNQNDLDDQLYILLASMKEYREAIADDKKRLEQFYKSVDKNFYKIALIASYRPQWLLDILSWRPIKYITVHLDRFDYS